MSIRRKRQMLRIIFYQLVQLLGGLQHHTQSTKFEQELLLNFYNFHSGILHNVSAKLPDPFR